MSRVAILAAMPSELKPLVRTWKKETVPRLVSIWTRQDNDGDEIVAACAGMGADAVRRAFAAVEQRGAIDLLISVGLAGSTGTGLKLGDVSALTEVINTQTGEHFSLTASQRKLRLATSVRTADVVEKKRLLETYAAALVDMEAATVARLAKMRELPMCCFKAVSDTADAVLPDIDRFVDREGQLQTLRFAVYLLTHPKYWGAVATLAKGSKLASNNLASALQQFLLHKDWDYTNRTGSFIKSSVNSPAG